jgi:hypothetical protein
MNGTAGTTWPGRGVGAGWGEVVLYGCAPDPVVPWPDIVPTIPRPDIVPVIPLMPAWAEAQLAEMQKALIAAQRELERARTEIETLRTQLALARTPTPRRRGRGNGPR